MAGEKGSKAYATNLGNVMSAICELGNSNAGEAIGKDPTFISRFKTNEKTVTMDEFVSLLTAAGLEVVPRAQDRITVDRQMYDSLLHLATCFLKNQSIQPEPPCDAS